MKFAEFFSGQRIITQLLQFFQSSKEEAIIERVTDAYDDGIVDTALNNMNIIGKDLDGGLLDFFHIKVDTGTGYKAGERILIDNTSLTYDATNPSDTTDDGLGNPLSTPHSTGSFDIPLTDLSINFIYIAYLQTTDETEFTLEKLSNAKQFYKRTDGYEIVVNITGVNPDSNRFLLLGQVDLLGANQAIAANTSIIEREIWRTKKERVGIETNNVGQTDRPSTYGLGNQKLSLDDHIKSTGTGTPNPFNPHGLTSADLGLDEANLVESHRKNEHVNGIIAGTPGNTAPQLTAMFVERVIVGLGDDFIRVKRLISGEFALVDGLAFDVVDFPLEVIITFVTATDAAGIYEIFFDSTDSTVKKQIGGVVGDNTKLRLASIEWDNAGNLGPATERRQFGTTNRLQRWFTSGRPPSPIAGNFGFNLDTNVPEFFDGTTWNNF